jgi:hypothetical protein
LPDKSLLEQIFSRYGKIRTIWMKQTEPNTRYRPHAFIDYEKPDDAQAAQKDMFESDNFGQKRAELGDSSCEVLLAIRKRNKEIGTPGSNN